MKKASLVSLAIAALALVVPQASLADHHCSGVFVFSGPSAMVSNPATPGINLGANGCNAEAANVDTNYLTPGADALRLGADGSETQAPTGGKVKFGNGAFQNVTFSWEPTRGRWISSMLAIPATAQTVTAVATTFEGAQTIVYKKLAG